MPRYFFHRTNGFVDHDQDGTEFPDLNAVRADAVVFAGESLREHPSYVWDGQEFRVEVTDQRGQLVLTVITLAVEARSADQAEDSQDDTHGI